MRPFITNPFICSSLKIVIDNKQKCMAYSNTTLLKYDVYVHIQMCMDTYKGQRLALDVFLDPSPLYLLKQIS